MVKNEDANTRYFIDLDLKNKEIINWNYDKRQGLSQELAKPFCQRVFITKGQYNKLEKKYQERLKKKGEIKNGRRNIYKSLEKRYNRNAK